MTSTLDKIKASAKDLQSPDPVLRGKAEEIKRRYQLGMFNHELEKEGAKPVPIKKLNFEAVDMSKFAEIPQEKGLSSTVPQVNPTFTDTMREMGGDVMQTAQNIGTTISEGAKNVQDIAGNDNLNIAQKSMGVLGSLMGTGARTIGDVTMGAGKMALTQDAEDQLKSFVQEKAQGIAETETVKKVADWYGNLTPENKLIVDSAGGFASLVSEIVGSGTAGKVAAPIKEGVGTAIDTAVDVTKKGIKVSGELGNKIQDTTRVSRLANAEAKANEAVSRIVQKGSPEDVLKAKKALMEASPEQRANIRDYTDIKNTADTNIEAFSKAQDTELGKYTDVYTKDQLSRYRNVKGINGNTISVADAPVIDALDQLTSYYAKTGDSANATIVKQYVDKLNSEGLTVSDLNNIAKKHGADLNAYNANNEVASGVSKQAIENTRQGLKDTLRQRLPNDASKALDESISAQYALKEIATAGEKKADELYRKLKKVNPIIRAGRVAGGAVADVLDVLTLGTTRGLIYKLFPPNVGNQTMNWIAIEKEIAKNVKKIDELMAIKDEKKFTEAVAKYLEEAQPGLSTRVKSNLTDVQKDNLLGKLQNVQSNDVMRKTGGIQGDEVNLELFDRLEQLKAKADKAPLTEREYAELNVLMDEVEQGAKQSIAPSAKSSKIPQTNLLNEAKKYKSAEEFVRAQPIVYHGSGVPLKKFSNKQGTFFTDDMMNAEGYAGGENVYEGYLNLKNPLIIDARGALHRELDTKWGNTTREIVGNVDKKKYDGVIFKNIKDSWIDDAEADIPSTIYYAFKPADSFINESQLTDIWKKANPQ